MIHPAQIAPVNDVFTPSAADLEHARRILDAADGASSVDGAMVDAASKRLAAGVIAARRAFRALTRGRLRTAAIQV